jgi:hypothetical protein
LINIIDYNYYRTDGFVGESYALEAAKRMNLPGNDDDNDNDDGHDDEVDEEDEDVNEDEFDDYLTMQLMISVSF